MATFLYNLIPVFLVVLVIVLGLGLVNMMRGGDPGRSQKLMRARVILQAVVLVIVGMLVYLMSG